MPVYTRKAFDELNPKEKRKSFTITALKNNKQSLERIEALRNLIADTIHITDEKKAWKQYFREARKLMKEEDLNVIQSDLFTSFRYARQTAYNRALEEMIAKSEDILWGIQWQSQDDVRVRPTHVKLDGLTRPVDDPIWDRLQAPLDFGCRCYKVPITKAMKQNIPGQYKMTPESEIPPIPRGFQA